MWSTARARQHGPGQRARVFDHRVGETGGAQELKGQLDVVVANRVRLLGLRRRGRTKTPPVARQRAGEEDVVDRSLRLGDGGDRIERRQVQERRHVAALQVEVASATSALVRVVSEKARLTPAWWRRGRRARRTR